MDPMEYDYRTTYQNKNNPWRNDDQEQKSEPPATQRKIVASGLLVAHKSLADIAYTGATWHVQIPTYTGWIYGNISMDTVKQKHLEKQTADKNWVKVNSIESMGLVYLPTIFYKYQLNV